MVLMVMQRNKFQNARIIFLKIVCDTEVELDDEHQPALKYKRPSVPAREQPAIGPACRQASKHKQTSGPARQQPAPRPAGEQQATGPASEHAVLGLQNPCEMKKLANDVVSGQ